MKKINCPVCENLNHINFGQEKIMRLKWEKKRITDSRDAIAKQLKQLRNAVKEEERRLNQIRSLQEKSEKVIIKLANLPLTINIKKHVETN